MPGRFLAAFDHRASMENEHSRIRLQAEGLLCEVRQIAGLIARRVVCWVKPGDRLERGERFGLIRFGSRVDVFLPAEQVEICAALGDRVYGGQTVIARVRRRGI